MNTRQLPICIAARHSTDEAAYDSILGWMGWCYTCEKMIGDCETVAATKCTECNGTGWHRDGAP